MGKEQLNNMTVYLRYVTGDDEVGVLHRCISLSLCGTTDKL
jgi:hypothetical protein